MSKSTAISELLAGLATAPLAEKAERIQAIYERVAYSPSGIIYSMQRLVDGDIRPFEPGDFEGALGINPSVGHLDIEGPWDYLHGENSITNSGIYLASQAYRLMVEDTPAAREQAAKAFRSLELIFEMGVADGKPGRMNKPYGFRSSPQTSPDQYSDACWGLYSYHVVAPPEHKRKIEQMLVAFADYWRGIDYTIKYFEFNLDCRIGAGYRNATMLLINVLAYHFTGKQVYRDEASWFHDHQNWMDRSDVVMLREQADSKLSAAEQTKPDEENWECCATPSLQPGEVLFCEGPTLCKFVAVAADIIANIETELLGDRMPALLEQWWEQGRYGVGDDLLPHYWIAADFRKGAWRPLPATAPVPREKWLYGDPFNSRVTGVRWCEPLARLLVTSVIARDHAPAMARRAEEQARRILDATDETRLHWMVDPDGQQLPPEIRYYGQCLSSEMPASFLAAYWRGKRDGLW